MKSSPVDTFCRAIVMGALLGAAGWTMVQYTTLPQQALQHIIVWSKKASEQLNQNPSQGIPQVADNHTVLPRPPVTVSPPPPFQNQGLSP